MQQLQQQTALLTSQLLDQLRKYRLELNQLIDHQIVRLIDQQIVRLMDQQIARLID